MPRVTADNVEVTYTADRVEMRVPVDGQRRKLVMSAAEAIRISNALGNAACDALPTDQSDNLPNVRDIKMKPFGHEGGFTHALLRIDLDAGPITVRVDGRWLLALAQAANAALEFANPAGTG